MRQLARRSRRLQDLAVRDVLLAGLFQRGTELCAELSFVRVPVVGTRPALALVRAGGAARFQFRVGLQRGQVKRALGRSGRGSSVQSTRRVGQDQVESPRHRGGRVRV